MKTVVKTDKVNLPAIIDPFDAKLIRLRENHSLTFDAIGERVKMPGSTVRYRVIAIRPDLNEIENVKKKERKEYDISTGLRKDPKKLADIKRRRRAKQTLQAIGDKYHVSRERIRQILLAEAPELLGRKYRSK